MAVKKTPFQESKKTKIDDKKAEIEEEQADQGRAGSPGGDPTPKAKRAYKKRATKPAFVPPTEENSAIEAKFFLELTGKLRQGAGITKPMPEFYSQMFLTSYHTMACKYGPVMSKWLPELMFGGTIFLIGLDTIVEIRKVKVAEALLAKKAKETEEEVDDLIKKKHIPGTDLLEV